MVTNRSMPSSVIIPELSYPDVREAVEWLCRTFGFKERPRIANHRAQLSFGGSLVVTHRGDRPNASFNIMVRVNDIDHHHEHAKSSGAKIISPPAGYPYAERQYTVGSRRSSLDVLPDYWGCPPKKLGWYTLRRLNCSSGVTLERCFKASQGG